MKDKISTYVQQWMARFLQRRDWVVFYLDPRARKCNDVCWLALYESEMAKEKE